MTIPSNIRVPFFYLEIDPSKALQGPKLLNYKALIMGQKTASGSKPELEINRVRSADEVGLYGGTGSQAHRIADKWFATNKTTETYLVLIDDADASVAATGTITITGLATESATLSLLLNGVSIDILIEDGDTPTIIGDKIVEAVNNKSILPFTATNAAGAVTLTAKNKGEVGNYFDLQDSFFDGQEIPEGITVGYTPFSGGTGAIDLDEILAVLGDEWYNTFVNPWSDASNMQKLQIELADRFGPIRMIDGVAATSVRGTPGALSTYASGKNYQHITCLHSEKVPNAPEEVAATYAAQWALEGEKDPARPFQTLILKNLLAPKVADRFLWSENNGLLYDGISTFSVDTSGNMRIQRAITMYQTNEFGADDISYLNLNTMLTLMYIRYDLRSSFLQRYPRAKLADDGARVPSGQVILTPRTIKAEVINIFKGWSETLGLTENIDQFKEDLDVVRSETDPDRVELLLSPDLINQLRVLAGIVQFLLQSPSI